MVRRLFFFVTICHAAFAGWLSHEQEGRAQAMASGKPLCIAYLGGDNCPWSTKLQREVLHHPDFLSQLENRWILVEVSQSPQASFEIPSVQLCDAAGNVILQKGYSPVSPKEFALQLKKDWEEYAEIQAQMPRIASLSLKALQDLYVKAKQVGNAEQTAKLLEQGLRKDKSVFFPLEKYAYYVRQNQMRTKEAKELRRSIVKRDASNANRSHFALALLDFENLARKRGITAKDAIHPLQEYIKKFGAQDPQGLWQVEIVMAQYLRNRNLDLQSEKHLKRALKIAPQEIKVKFSSPSSTK